MIAFRECSCRPGSGFADGSRPEYYSNRVAAIIRFKFHTEIGTPFWAVHLNGKHMLRVVEPPFVWGGLDGKSRIG